MVTSIDDKVPVFICQFLGTGADLGVSPGGPAPPCCQILPVEYCILSVLAMFSVGCCSAISSSPVKCSAILYFSTKAK